MDIQKELEKALKDLHTAQVSVANEQEAPWHELKSNGWQKWAVSVSVNL